MNHQIIHLRRPPVLHVQDEPFVPLAASMDEIDRRWRALCAQNPAYFDGRIYHVLGVHRNGCGGATLHVMECAYRFHAVQSADLDLNVTTLGVKGLIKRDGRYLLGRRSENVAHYAGLWEFAPGGVVEPGKTPVQTVCEELREEVGVKVAHDPVAIAMVYDELLRTWEIVYRIELDDDQSPVESEEYSEITWRSRKSLPADLSPLANRMVPLLS